jgi:hypothetical protein
MTLQILIPKLPKPLDELEPDYRHLIEQYAAYAVAGVLDCRTCANFCWRICASDVPCNQGSQYTPTMPLRLWDET